MIIFYLKETEVNIKLDLR